jgi:hypothetical protein
MSKSTCHHFVVDAFPLIDGPHFSGFAGAAVGCWIPTDNPLPDNLVESELRAEGWMVGRIIRRSTVSPRTYAHKENGRREFKRALTHGFAAHFHVRRREIIDLDDRRTHVFSADAYLRFLRSLRGGGFSFVSDGDQQWANGVTPDGDEFVPLWVVREDAVAWQDHWRDFNLEDLSVQALVAEDGLLRGIAHEEMWVAMGSATALVSVHPLCLLRDLLADD